MTYTVQYNNDETVTISEEVYEELQRKADNYEWLIDILSKAIRDAIKE